MVFIIQCSVLSDNEVPLKKIYSFDIKLCVSIFSFKLEITGFKLHVFIMKGRWVVRKEHERSMESVPAKKKFRGKVKLSQSVGGERTVFSISGAR